MDKARHYDIGDWVLVDRRNLQVKAGNNKSLTQKWLGPYRVEKAIEKFPKEHDDTTSSTPPSSNHSDNELWEKFEKLPFAGLWDKHVNIGSF